MNARELGVVAVGVLGIVLVLAGVFQVANGIAMIVMYRRMNEAFSTGPDVPILQTDDTSGFTYASGLLLSGAFFVIFGFAVSRFREWVADRWATPSGSGGGTPGLPGIDLVGRAAVGCIGLWFVGSALASIATIQISNLVDAFSTGTDSEMWGSLVFLILGLFLTLRPQWIAWFWRAPAA